ncbi:MAG: hypothetical protein AAGF12_27380 [Myxococcota bacterium]
MRADRTMLCTACRLRFAPRDTCPACDGSRTVYDMRREDERERAADVLSHMVSRGVTREWIGLGGPAVRSRPRRRQLVAIFLVLALVVVSPLLSVRMRLGPVGLPLVILGLSFLWVLGRRGLAALLSRRERQPFELSPLDPDMVPAAKAIRVRGRIRSPNRLQAPLSGESCVAARVVGSTFGGTVDDALGQSFDLETEDGAIYKVDLGQDGAPSHVWIDLAVQDVPKPVDPSARLEGFLSRRGLFPSEGPLVLAEAVLRDGDLVEVQGVVEPQPVTEGYRDVDYVETFAARAHAPLMVRAG